MCPCQDRERSEPWHGLRPSPAQLSVPMLWKGVFTTHHPRAAAELPLCLQRAKHTQPIVNNNITEFFHIPDSSQHPQRSLIVFFHCTITVTCDSISAVGSAWHTPSISTAPSGSLPPLSLLHLTPPTSRLARKWKICFQLTFASTHKFSPFHSLLITVIPKWPPNELSISCKTCFHMNCILNVSAYKTRV